MAEQEKPVIDYNYHTDPAFMQYMLDKVGLQTLLTFCQLNHVQILRGEDWMYYAYINGDEGGCWGTDLDAFSALVMGIASYIEHNGTGNRRRDQDSTQSPDLTRHYADTVVFVERRADDRSVQSKEDVETDPEGKGQCGDPVGEDTDLPF